MSANWIMPTKLTAALRRFGLKQGWTKSPGIRDDSWPNAINSENAGKVDGVLHTVIPNFAPLPGSKGWDNPFGLMSAPPKRGKGEKGPCEMPQVSAEMKREEEHTSPDFLPRLPQAARDDSGS